MLQVCMKLITTFIFKGKNFWKKEKPDSDRTLKIKIMSRGTLFSTLFTSATICKVRLLT